MEAEKTLWQSVVFRAVADALHPRSGLGRSEAHRATRAARRWFRDGGKDYREVCSNAGMNADFIRESILSGRITYKDLSNRPLDGDCE